MEKIKKILKSLINRETVTYLIFGVLTTVVNFGIFKLVDLTFEKAFTADLTLLTNFIAWVGSVIFAYVTNKLFVFESKSWAWQVLIREVPSFVAARVASFGIEEAGLFVSESLLGLNTVTVLALGSFCVDGVMASKLALSVIVVVLNYFFSKWFIFKK